MHASAIRRVAARSASLANSTQALRSSMSAAAGPSTVLAVAAHRQLTTSARRRAAEEVQAPSAAETPAVGDSPLLRSTAKAAARTPGIKWADGEEGIERETRKMNMYTVGAASRVGVRGGSGSGSVRSYATAAVQAAPAGVVAKGKGKAARKYPERKGFLHDQYQRLLDESQLMVALQHNNLSVTDIVKLRRDLAALAPPQVGPGETARPAKLTFVRAGIMRKVCAQSASPQVQALRPVFSGPVAVLTCSSLAPKYLASLFEVVDKTLGHKPARAPAQGKPFPLDEQNANPRLVPLAALLERSRLLHIPAAREVGRLPDLHQLRAQIAGLLSAPAQQLAGTLQRAAGVDVALTLDARKRDLEQAEQPAAAAAA